MKQKVPSSISFPAWNSKAEKPAITGFARQIPWMIKRLWDQDHVIFWKNLYFATEKQSTSSSKILSGLDYKINQQTTISKYTRMCFFLQKYKVSQFFSRSLKRSNDASVKSSYSAILSICLKLNNMDCIEIFQRLAPVTMYCVSLRGNPICFEKKHWMGLSASSILSHTSLKKKRLVWAGLLC